MIRIPTINLYHRECMELMRETPDGFYDLAIVDPPYGIEINTNMGRRKGNKKSNYHEFHGGDKSIPDAEYFSQLLRISKHQIVWGGNYMTQFLPPSPCWILWDKGFSEEVTFAQFELAWTSFASSAKKFDYNTARQKSRLHPTQKPVSLYKWILSRYAKPGDRILDTHGGSMSIAIACYDLGFDLDLTELDKDYYEAGKARFERHKAQGQLFRGYTQSDNSVTQMNIFNE